MRCLLAMLSRGINTTAEILDEAIKSAYTATVVGLVLFALAYAKVLSVTIAFALGLAWLVAVFGIARYSRVRALQAKGRIAIALLSATAFGIGFSLLGIWIINQTKNASYSYPDIGVTRYGNERAMLQLHVGKYNPAMTGSGWPLSVETLYDIDIYVQEYVFSGSNKQRLCGIAKDSYVKWNTDISMHEPRQLGTVRLSDSLPCSFLEIQASTSKGQWTIHLLLQRTSDGIDIEKSVIGNLVADNGLTENMKITTLLRHDKLGEAIVGVEKFRDLNEVLGQYKFAPTKFPESCESALSRWGL
jgi:hypothetical protein